MTFNTECYQILSRIIAQSASRLNVMHLKSLHASTPLTTPTVSLEDFTAELAIGFSTSLKRGRFVRIRVKLSLEHFQEVAVFVVLVDQRPFG